MRGLYCILNIPIRASSAPRMTSWLLLWHHATRPWSKDLHPGSQPSAVLTLSLTDSPWQRDSRLGGGVHLLEGKMLSSPDSKKMLGYCVKIYCVWPFTWFILKIIFPTGTCPESGVFYWFQPQLLKICALPKFSTINTFRTSCTMSNKRLQQQKKKRCSVNDFRVMRRASMIRCTARFTAVNLPIDPV